MNIYLYKGLLNKGYYLSIYFLIFLSILTSFFEALGLTLIPTILLMIINPQKIIDLINKYFYFLEINLTSIEQNLTFYILTLFFIIFILRFIFLFFYTVYSTNFFYKIRTDYTNLIFKNYTNLSYENLSSKGRSHLYNNLVNNSAIPALIIRYVLSILKSSILLIFLIFTLFLTTDLKLIILISAILILFLFIYNKYFKNFFSKLGNIALNSRRSQIKLINKFLYSLKEIRLIWFINVIKKNYNEIILKLNYSKSFSEKFNKLSYYIFEVFIIAGLLSFLLIYNSHSNIVEVIPKITIIIVILIKSLPLFTEIINNLSLIKINSPALKKIQSDISKINYLSEKKKIFKINFKNKIELKNLSFKYKNDSDYCLKNINLKINKNDMIGIYGDSGSGKTTLLDILCGLIKPTEGKLVVDDKVIKNKKDFYSWNNHIKYFTQTPFLLDGTLKKNILYDLSNEKFSHKDISKIYFDLNINKNKKLDYQYSKQVSEDGTNFSHGEIQRIAFARILFNKRKNIILLDEVTNFLDKKNKKVIIEKIKSLRGKNTIILISHDKYLINLCQKIYKLQNKKLIIKKRYE